MTIRHARHRVRSFLDRLIALSGLLRLYEGRMRRGLTILMYHRVLPMEQCIDYPLPALVIPVDAFRQQMRWLADHCRVLPVSDALVALNKGDTFSKPLVALTFDDGYEDNYTLAVPILEAHGLSGTFYVASGFVATGKPQWYDRAASVWRFIDKQQSERLLALLDRATPGWMPARCTGKEGHLWMEGLKRAAPALRHEIVSLAEHLAGQPFNNSNYRPMRPDQVSAMHAQGHEIGSHTVSHPIMPQLADGELADELRKSAVQLTGWTGADIAGFCYPNGDYDARVERAVIQAGYQYACTTREGINRASGHPFRIERLPVTMQRTMCGAHYEPLGFRTELCRARSIWRL